MPFDYLRVEAKAGRMGQRLMAIVAEGNRGRIYLTPTPEQEVIAAGAQPSEPPETDLPARALGFRVQEYGMTKWRDLFTDRQLVALTTFSDLVQEARERIKRDAIAAPHPNPPPLGEGVDSSSRRGEAGRWEDLPLVDGGTGATAYAEAVGVYLAFALSRTADRGSTICSWDNSPKMEALRNTFGRQAIPMVWDFA